jgi:hypothetical protein
MPPPRFSAELNWGHVLTILTLVIGGALAWGAHSEVVAAMQASTSELKATSAAHERELRAITVDVGRQAERIANHVEFWKRVEAKIDSMESRFHDVATKLGKQSTSSRE